MTTITINAAGLAEIRKFLAARHTRGDQFTREMLRAWAADAEFQAAEGNAPTIEIKSWDAVSGHTETYTISDQGFDEVVMIDVYTVDADRVTGEWLGEPEYSHTEDRSAWHARVDTDEVHYDTYEVGDPSDAETRAIEVRWVE